MLLVISIEKRFKSKLDLNRSNDKRKDLAVTNDYKFFQTHCDIPHLSLPIESSFKWAIARFFSGCLIAWPLILAHHNNETSVHPATIWSRCCGFCLYIATKNSLKYAKSEATKDVLVAYYSDATPSGDLIRTLLLFDLAVPNDGRTLWMIYASKS